MHFSWAFLLVAGASVAAQPALRLDHPQISVPQESWLMLSAQLEEPTSNATDTRLVAATTTTTTTSTTPAVPGEDQLKLAKTQEIKPQEIKPHGSLSTADKTKDLVHNLEEIVQTKVNEIAKDAEQTGFLTGKSAERLESSGGGSFTILLVVILVVVAAAAVAIYYFVWRTKPIEREENAQPHED